jgi:host cell surface-exposed lipoprotein
VKKKFAIPTIVGALALGGIVAIGVAGSSDNAVPVANPVDQFTTTTSQPIPQMSEPASTAAPVVTAGEQSSTQVELARHAAQSYLGFKGFSRDGLIQQLTSAYGDGYPKAVATEAVDSLNADWNAQAAKSAQSYLSVQAFSCSALIRQLTSPYGDAFTKEQASYGAHQTPAC